MAPPPFKATRKLKNEVMLLVATNMGERGIAQALGIGRETLRKYFAHELEVGRASTQAWLMKQLRTAAEQGNVAAQKYLDAKCDGYQLNTTKTLGKKEQQSEAAKVAGMGTEWEADLMRVMPQADDKPN